MLYTPICDFITVFPYVFSCSRDTPRTTSVSYMESQCYSSEISLLLLFLLFFLSLVISLGNLISHVFLFFVILFLHSLISYITKSFIPTLVISTSNYMYFFFLDIILFSYIPFLCILFLYLTLVISLGRSFLTFF